MIREAKAYIQLVFQDENIPREASTTYTLLVATSQAPLSAVLIFGQGV